MYSRTVFASLFTCLLALSPTLATPLHRRDKPVREPMCTGLGLGLTGHDDYLVLINQIDITATYDIPWDSGSLASGRTHLNNGDVSMSVTMQADSDTGVIVGSTDKGTISGLTLQYQLGLLNNQVNENQVSCDSSDGTYAYWLGSGL